MKKLLILTILSLFVFSLFGQLRLDVVGDAKIDGRLDISSNTNLFIGTNTGIANTTGTNNFFLGVDAGSSNTEGGDNTFVGKAAGQANTIGEGNTFFGQAAGLNNLEANGNTFFGESSGATNINGNDNTFLGRTSGVGNTIGSGNTFVGKSAGSDNTSGAENTFLGLNTGANNTTGTRNTFLGNNAQHLTNEDSLDRAIAIGYNAKVNCHNCAVIGGTAEDAVKVGIGTNTPSSFLDVQGANSNKTVINAKVNYSGNSDVPAVYGYSIPNSFGWGIGGDFYGGYKGLQGSITSNTSGGSFGVVGSNDAGGTDVKYGVYGGASSSGTGTKYGVYGFATSNGTNSWAIYGNGDFYYTGSMLAPSDARLKKKIQGIDNALKKVMQLKPQTYQFKTEDYPYMNLAQGQQFGFISQDVEKIFPEVVEAADHVYNLGVEKSQKGTFKTVNIKSLNYISFIPIVTAAIQEQQQIIEEQKEEYLELKDQLQDQQQQIDELKSLVEKLIATKEDNSYVLPLEQQPLLAQNQPNPFHQNTIVDYFIPSNVQDAKIQVTTVDGKVLGVVEINEVGIGQVTIKASTYPVGTYFYSLVLDGQVFETKRMVLTRYD